jgi:hypothetical protein
MLVYLIRQGPVKEPLLERPTSFRGLQSTDPYVFGDRFLYTGYQQHTNGGARETQLRRPRRGSVILFGSCRDLARLVVDTVFVVAGTSTIRSAITRTSCARSWTTNTERSPWAPGMRRATMR